MACENKHECPCTKTDCDNYKRCCDCVAAHIARGNLPFCLRPKTEEK